MAWSFPRHKCFYSVFKQPENQEVIQIVNIFDAENLLQAANYRGDNGVGWSWSQERLEFELALRQWSLQNDSGIFPEIKIPDDVSQHRPRH